MSRPVSVNDMLAARDARAARQDALAREFGGSIEGESATAVAVVSITLVTPGPDKNPIWATAVFDAAMRAAADALPGGILHTERHDDVTGPQGYLVSATPPIETKRALVAAEDTHPWGRLFDLDVVVAGVPLQRADVGAPPRRCLVCDGPAAPCARSRAHDLTTLAAAITSITSITPVAPGISGTSITPATSLTPATGGVS